MRSVSSLFLLGICKLGSLQNLGADELGPAADLRGNTVRARQLGVHSLGEEKSSLQAS